MRIGFDISSQSLPRSGVGQYQIHLLRALLLADPENFYHLYGFNLRNRHRFKTIHFPSQNYDLYLSPVPQRVMTLWWLMFQQPSLEQIVGTCDLYHVSELCIQPTRKGKTVAFVHDLTTLLHPEYHTASNTFLHRERFKRILRVDGILTNSEFTKKDLINHLGIKPETIFVTPLGADDRFRPMADSKITPVLRAFGIKKPYLLFVGTLEPRKNVEALIRAFNALKEKYWIPHQLVLVGQKGWLYQDIMKAVEFSPFRGDILSLDYVPDSDIPALMSGADVFVYPSFYEGFGLPVLEAMQCGCPVITSNVSSLPEVGGDACLYVHPESSDELSEKIYEVIRDKSLQKTLSMKGAERAKQFSWKKCAQKTLAAYQAVAGR